MNKKIIVKQSGFKDCAVACLLSIIRYNNENIRRRAMEGKSPVIPGKEPENIKKLLDAFLEDLDNALPD